MWNLILHPTSTHIAYFWWTPLFEKQEIPEKMWWWHHHHIFFRYFLFWGSEVRQKCVVWVLVGCGIKFYIQWALPLRIWVKTKGDMSKIRTKEVVFFILPPKLITIILLFYYFNYYFIIFLRRHILDLKFPLMKTKLRRRSMWIFNIFCEMA